MEYVDAFNEQERLIIEGFIDLMAETPVPGANDSRVSRTEMRTWHPNHMWSNTFGRKSRSKP